jgi:MHS family proline/betaine transporter-like MFS transporter
VLIGVVGFWLRLGIAESPRFLQTQKAGQLADNPLAEAMRKNVGAMLTTLGLTGLSAVGFYLPFVWLPVWLAQINQPALPESQALLATTMALLTLLLLTPVTAVVSDRVGRKPMFLAAALGYTLLSYPLFQLMTSGTFASAVTAGLVFAVCNSLFSGCMGATMVEQFPTRTRYTGVAIGYNVGQALLGGTAPLVATGLIDLTKVPTAPVYYLIACAAIGGVTALFIKERHAKPLD